MILVTGGTGFIGSYLVRYLLDKGEEVRVLVRDPSKLKFNVDYVVGDITDERSLDDAFKDVDEVYHLAAIFRHGVDAEKIWRVNYYGTKNVVKKCLEYGCKLLHVSTVGVLGYANSKPLDESSPYKPNPNPYSRSKAKAEQFVVEMCKEGLKAKIVRPAFVYGVGSRYGLNLLIDMVVNGKLRFVIGRGNNYIHPIHVADLVEAMVLVMNKAKVGGIYIVANEKPTKLREFLDTVAKFAGVRLRYGFPPKLAYILLKLKGGIGGSSARETIMAFTKNWFYSTDKLRALGWKQKIELEDGVRDVVRWLKSQ
jgi:nucleoside-diphosphate-sugar epimerase